MSALSVLLARDQVVPLQKIDEAIQRQVINGGDFETNLLEIGAIQEDTLTAYYAAVHAGVAIARAELAAAEPAALAALPRDFVEVHRVVPVRDEGEALIVVTATPPGRDVRGLLEHAAGREIVVRVATPFRVAWALWKFYGIELTPRLQRLASRLADLPSGDVRPASLLPGRQSVQPAAEGTPMARARLHSALAALAAALEDDNRMSSGPDEPQAAHDEHDEAEAEAEARHADEPVVAPREWLDPLDDGPVLEAEELVASAGERLTPTVAHPALAAERAAVERSTAPEPALVERMLKSERPTSMGFAAVVEAPAVVEAGPVDPGLEERTREVRVAVPPEARASQPAAAAEVPPQASREVAVQRIARAESRDQIVSAVLDFAGARLAYTAIFVVQGDVAEGLDARGDGLSSESVRGIAVPLDAPGALRSARERGQPVVGPLGQTGTDAVVKADLGRNAARGVALLPIHIGGRVVLVVWADNGPAPLDLAAVDAVVELCGHAAQAFERLIVERKRRRPVTAPRKSIGVAAATDATKVTPAGLAQRVAEQRGVQALRALVASGGAAATPSVTSSLAVARDDDDAELLQPTPVVPMVTPTAVDGLAVSPLDVARSEPRDTVETATAGPSAGPRVDAGEGGSRGTMYAHGGRVPVSVDIIGPLPGSSPPRRLKTSRPPRAADLRRESEGAAGEPVDEYAALVAEIVRQGSASEAATNALLGGGERALAAVFQWFPGPTTLDRLHPLLKLPPVGDVGPLLRLVVLFRQASAPRLLERLEAAEPEQRFFATLCLAEVVQPTALPHLLGMLFDADFPTRVLAVEVLRAYRRFPEFEQVARALRAVVADLHAPAERRRIAANALGELRDAEAVPALAVALGDADGAVASLARRALVVLSRQDFGDQPSAWREWWERAAGRHRVEWLMEALLHPEPTIRHDASEELKKLTGQFFGYYFNLPRRERERAHQRYLEWWQGEGRARFLR